ncbi:MAG: flavin monoamine oxidase family protein, partial [Woeseiaceae bacterium]
MDTKVVVVGGGLAGLSLADKLAQNQQDFLLLEAEEQLGGRILTEEIAGGHFDLGPAWFWPGQTRMESLIASLGLQYFEQYSEGDMIFQDPTGASRRFDFGTMANSYRVKGGMGALISGLNARLPQSSVRTSATVTELQKQDAGVRVLYDSDAGQESVLAERVVLAVPPRVLANTIRYSPELTSETLSEMSRIPTWMAGQAKIVAVYDQPYWRNAGLSGDGSSQKGPMVEIHDASPADGGPYALFGFVGYLAAARAQLGTELVDRARSQLVEMFGQELASPVEIRLKDWAQVSTIAAEPDRIGSSHHSVYGSTRSLKEFWSGNVILSPSEMGEQFGGYLEG